MVSKLNGSEFHPNPALEFLALGVVLKSEGLMTAKFVMEKGKVDGGAVLEGGSLLRWMK